jgi:hypothetical protein
VPDFEQGRDVVAQGFHYSMPRTTAAKTFQLRASYWRLIGQRLAFAAVASSCTAAPARHDLKRKHGQRHYQQNVHQTTADASKKAQHPQHHKHSGNYPHHENTSFVF